MVAWDGGPSFEAALHSKRPAGALDAAAFSAFFYDERGTAEQRIKEGKGAIKRTRLSCPTFAANAVRLQLR
jgi:Transposase DDE domain group 1